MKIKKQIIISTAVSIGLALLVSVMLSIPIKHTNQTAQKYKTSNTLVQSVTDLIILTEEFLSYRYPRVEQQWQVSYDKIIAHISNDVNHLTYLKPKLRELLQWFERIKSINKDMNGPSRGMALPDEISKAVILEARLSTNMRLTARSILRRILRDSQSTGDSFFESTNRTFWAIIGSLTILILIFAFNAYFTARRIFPPLEELIEKAGRIMNGDMKQKLKPGEEGSRIRAGNEIGNLATTFENMNQKLFQSLYDLKNEVKERKLNEAKFRGIYEQSPIAIELYDKDGKLIDVNQQTLNMFGVEDKKHVIGFELWEDPNISVEKMNQLKNGKTIFISSEFDFEIVKSHNLYPTSRSGKIYWELYALPLMKGKKIDGYLVQVIEITKRKKAEIALQKEREKLKVTLQSIGDGVITTDVEGKVVLLNKVAESLTGWRENEAIGKKIDEIFHIVNEHTRERCQSPVERVLETSGIIGLANDTLLLARNGSERVIADSGAPIVDTNGDTVGVVLVFRDITDKIGLESELRQAQKMESIGTLTGGIAHDFNNILGIIVGNTELALDDVPKWNSAHASLEEIKTASLRAKNIVRQLLSFSRKTDQKLQPIQIALVIKDALKFLRSTIPTTINIHPDIPTTDETILADPTQINQIIMNLCINASHAMEQTGGDLNVAVAKVVLDDNSARDYPGLKSGDHVRIIVSDTGPGIDPEIINQIFDPYFTTKEVGKGSGMGLAVVHGIVKSHSGAIAVDSKKGKGTKFIMLFPLTNEKPMVEDQSTLDIPRGNETILFVDDEISITKMVKRMFERLGYKVETATTPQNALDRFSLDPDHFDLVITDMTMPQMTGVKLSEKLMEIREDIPIIVCTGHSTLVNEEKAKELGLAAYVMKPIDMQETAQTIRKVLDRK